MYNCSSARKLQSPSTSNESPSTPSNITHPVLYTNSNTQPVSSIILQSSVSDTLFCPSPGRYSPALGAPSPAQPSPSRSAMSLSPTKETTLAFSPTAEDSTSAVPQESNQEFELQYSSLLSEKPTLLMPSPVFFPREQGTKSKLECNTKTKLFAKLM